MLTYSSFIQCTKLDELYITGILQIWQRCLCCALWLKNWKLFSILVNLLARLSHQPWKINVKWYILHLTKMENCKLIITVNKKKHNPRFLNCWFKQAAGFTILILDTFHIKDLILAQLRSVRISRQILRANPKTQIFLYRNGCF